jgi:hypothetical protein
MTTTAAASRVFMESQTGTGETAVSCLEVAVQGSLESTRVPAADNIPPMPLTSESRQSGT